MTDKRITYYAGPDWDAVYVDGKLAYQESHIEGRYVVEALDGKINYDMTDELIEQFGGYPADEIDLIMALDDGCPND